MEKGNMPIETDLNDLKETDSLKAKEKDNAINYKEELINEKIASLDSNENKIESINCKFIMMLIILFIQAIMTHIIKPVCTFLEIIFLTRTVDIKRVEFNASSAETLSDGVKVIGWLILFLLPFINFFSVGIMIIMIQKSTVSKIYAFFLSLFEIIFQFPLTFMYSSNLHSVFLFEQRGLEQILCPWLIFFPSDYIISIYEIIRQLIESIFFFICGYFVYDDIKDNKYQAFNVSFLLVLMVLCAMKFISVIVMIFIRAIKGNSEERGKKTTEIMKQQIELENMRRLTTNEEFLPIQKTTSNEIKLDGDSNEKKNN